MRLRYAGRVEWDAADYWMSFVNSAGMNASTRSSSSVADAAGRERGGSSGAEQNRTMAQRSARCSNRSGSAASNRAGSVCNRRWHSGYGIMNGSMGQWNLLTQQSARTRPAAATKRKKKGTDPFFFLFFLSATAGNSPESGRHNFLRVPAMVMAKPKAGSFRQCR